MLATAVENKRGVPGPKIYENKKLPEKFAGLSETEKLQAISLHIREQAKQIGLRRNPVHYMMALYYQGYQNIEMNDGALDVFERPDYYVENQFRHQADATVNALCKNEGDIVTRPRSASPKDISKARVAGPVLDMQKAEINYKSLKVLKNLYKVLFGTSFQFVDYIRDKKYGVTVTPKYSYEEVPDEEGGEPFMAKVEDGMTEVNKGKEIGLPCSPLEVSVLPDVKTFDDLPWLQWKSRQPSSLLNYMYPGLGAEGGGAGNDDMGQHYLDLLANLPGNVLGDSSTANGDTRERKCEYLRTWITPCMFLGDKKLLAKYPDGVHVAMVDGAIVDYYAESLFKHWTYEVLIVNPHSLLGDGLYDALLLQDIINEANSLILQHTRYSSTGKNIFDEEMLDPAEVKNDPANGWLKARTTIDKKITESVLQIRPTPLSGDVPAWLSAKLSSMQDMTSAYDPSIGKGIGANTPYSQSVFLTERAQSRWQGSLEFNEPQLIRFHHQLLELTKEWTEPRTAAVIANTGAYSFNEFVSSDLEGEVDIMLSGKDMQPKGRAEQVQALTMLQQMTSLLPTLSPKQKLEVEEILGLSPDSNPMSTQISRAYRNIDRIMKGEDIAPLPMVDEPNAQVPVFADFLASEDGDELALTDPEARAKIYVYMSALMNLMQMQQGFIQPGQQQGAPPPGGGGKPPQEGGIPGGQGHNAVQPHG